MTTMKKTLHITNGDSAGGSLKKSRVPGEVLAWQDMVYHGPRCAGWPDEDTLMARAAFLEEATGGGLDRAAILESLRTPYRKLSEVCPDTPIVLWFDACLFDQAVLALVLACLRHQKAESIELICVQAFPGISPFHGLGQLTPEQFASVFADRLPVTDEQFEFAVKVDAAFTAQDTSALTALAQVANAPLSCMPAAIERWLAEWPDAETGLGRLETLALNAIRAGHTKPAEIFAAVAAADTPPQFWRDLTLWAKINALAERMPPLVTIDGPASKLPQWQSAHALKDFTIRRTQ